MNQFVTQEQLDVLIDGEFAIREVAGRIRECPEEDASTSLLVDIAGMLLSDIAEGRDVPNPDVPTARGRQVTALPRITRLYELARARATGADRALVQGSYEAIASDVGGSAAGLGVGLITLATGYARGLCYRSIPLPQGVAEALDDFERLAERREAALAAAGALPWALGAGLVAVVAWLVFGKKR